MVGIYAIKNKINGKIYVGQSWDIKSRWGRHKQNSNKLQHIKEHLYLSINKYGINNFEFIMLKEMDSNTTQADLDYYEEYFIKFYNSSDKKYGYNKKSGGSRGKHSLESNEKNRLAHIGKSINKGVPKTEETKINMSLNRPDISGDKNPMWGRKHSKETKLKISIKAKQRTGNKNPFFGKHHTEENINKSKQRAIKQFGRSVLCHNNNKIYACISDADRDLNLDYHRISLVCRGILKNYKGYTFSFT